MFLSAPDNNSWAAGEMPAGCCDVVRGWRTMHFRSSLIACPLYKESTSAELVSDYKQSRYICVEILLWHTTIYFFLQLVKLQFICVDHFFAWFLYIRRSHEIYLIMQNKSTRIFWLVLSTVLLGPVVQRPISANPGLNFNLGFFIPLLKSLFGIIFSVLFKASNSHTLD